MLPTWFRRAQIGTIVIATSVIQIANGFFGTFISLRVALESFDAAMAGAVLSSYFGGFTLGALSSGKILERIGHIRAYTAFAGLVAAATAAMPLMVEPWPWVILRALVGFGCAGVFIATESWLNVKALPSERGRVFSIYMVGTFLALAMGQLLIGHVKIGSSEPFCGIVALFAVALVMVSAARAEPPRISAVESVPFISLARAAPVAVVGCAVSGLATGAFYALVPAWMQEDGIEQANIAVLMLAAVLGGFAFQVPVGRLSDRYNRRAVLAVLGLGFIVTSLTIIFLPHPLLALLPAVILLGGFMSTLYPVCVADAHDCMPADQIAAVSARLILVSGLGSVLGPLIGASLMARLGIDGVFYLMAIAILPLVIVAVRGRKTSPVHVTPAFEILAPQAGPLAHDSLCSFDESPRVDPGEMAEEFGPNRQDAMGGIVRRGHG